MTRIVEIKMPDIGDLESVEITEINTTIQSHVTREDILLTVESDKASLEIPCGLSGTLQSFNVTIGDTLSQGDLIALIEVTNDEINETIKKTPTLSETLSKPSLTQPTKPDSNKANHTIIPAGPAARRLARELGINLSEIHSRDKRGRIHKSDIKAHAKQLISRKQTALNHAPPDLPDLSIYGPIHQEKMSNIEKTTSSNMQRIWQVPHAWVQNDIDITEIEAGRQRLKASIPGLTITALIVKVAAQTLSEFPRFNAALEPRSSHIIYRDYIHIGVAIDTPRGLLVMVIKHADQLNVAQIAIQLRHLGQAAREGKLKTADMHGAGFTISNLGGMGSSGMQPLVNWPEVAVLGIASSKKQPVYVGDEIKPRIIMPMTLGFDHRVINGADGSRFLTYIQNLLEDPMSLLVQL